MNHYENLAISDINGQSRNGLVQSRLRGFGTTMIVMGISFIFYYLGLFGSVDGPLNPDTIGLTLSTWGVTRFHVILCLSIMLVGAVAWNWVINLVCFAMGRRLTCTATPTGAVSACGSEVNRIRRVSRRSGKTIGHYVCARGHHRPDAQFHPIKKGTTSHFCWLACLAFLLIVICYA